MIKTSFVFKTGLVSLIKIASRIIKCFSVCDVAKIFTSSKVSLTPHCKKCEPTGAETLECSLMRVVKCQLDCPTQRELHREQQISYTTPLFKDFSTGAFKDGRTVFSLRSVIITLHGASILFNACSNFSISLPRYCKNIIAFSTSSSSSVSSCLSSGFVMIVFNVFLKIGS